MDSASHVIDPSSISVDQLVATGLPADKAHALFNTLQTLYREIHSNNTGNTPPNPPPAHALWRVLSTRVLRPEHPFSLHRLLAHWTYGSDLHPPLWVPTPEVAATTNVARFMQHTYKGPSWYEQQKTNNPLVDFPLFQQATASHAPAFWPQFLDTINFQFTTPPTNVLQLAPTADACVWFPGARLNIAASCLHAAPTPDAPAIISASELNPEHLSILTYAQLHTRATRFAAALATRVPPGTRVAIIMPMTPDAVVAFLGVLLARCVMVGIAESFAAPEIQTRLQLVDTRLVVTQDVMVRNNKSIPLYQRIVQADAPPAIIVATLSTTTAVRPGDVLMHDLLHTTANAPPPTPTTDAQDLTMIMFSSGTTGQPKAIPWNHITPLKAALDAWAHQDVRHGDVVAWPTSLGWVMGPWLVYASLLNGASMALFDGSPLDRPFGRFLVAARVTMLGLVPSIAKAWRASGCMQGLPLHASLRCISSTGEASAPEDYHWLMALAGYCPIIEYCGGTEIGGAFLTGSMLQPASPSTFSTPALCTRLVLLDTTTGAPLDTNITNSTVTGELTVVAPSIGLSQMLLNKDHAKAYYHGMPPSPYKSASWLRRHGDEVCRMGNGYYVALGRTDDTMNLGGIKVGSVEIERCVVQGVDAVQEAAAVGVPTPGGGPERLWLFVVVQGQGVQEGALLGACNSAIRAKLNPLFRAERVVVVGSLPRNASNKVMRRVLRDQQGSAKGSSSPSKL